MSTPEAVLSARGDPMRPVHVRLAGLGSSLPAPIVANRQIAARTGVDEAWITRRTGISTRRHAPADLSLVELAANAADDAVADAGLDVQLIDLVIVATVSHEQPMPNVAPQVAERIGALNAAAFDLGAACAGFMAGLATAAAHIEAGRAEHVLLVAADMLSRQTDPADRRTAALFGDGAGAAVLAASAGSERWVIELGTDGANAGLIANDPSSGLISMNGHDTFIQAVRHIEQATRSVLAAAGVRLDEVDLFVFHQANARITRAVVERLQIDPDRAVECIAELGNTSAASIPLALEHARGSGRLASGQTVLLAAVGAGLTWGAALIEWELP